MWLYDLTWFQSLYNLYSTGFSITASFVAGAPPGTTQPPITQPHVQDICTTYILHIPPTTPNYKRVLFCVIGCVLIVIAKKLFYKLLICYIFWKILLTTGTTQPPITQLPTTQPPICPTYGSCAACSGNLACGWCEFFCKSTNYKFSFAKVQVTVHMSKIYLQTIQE